MAVVYGDFNGDKLADLAIGAPTEDVGTLTDAGAVSVTYADNSGRLDTTRNIHFSASEMLTGDAGAEAGDEYGHALAVGDFNGDGFDDLAVGAPGEDVGPIRDAGLVEVLYGSMNGLILGNRHVFTQDSANLPGDTEAFDRFGFSLAAGDFNGDGVDDLAIGSPYENNDDGINDAGAVQILYGSNVAGRVLGTSHMQFSVGERYGFFGYSLAAGNFNGDFNGARPIDDLAIGVPGADVNGIQDAGAVRVFFGRTTGLDVTSFTNGMDINQDSVANGYDVQDTAEPGDFYGWSLATGRLNNDSLDDLVVGIPFENVGTTEDAGAVNVLFGHSVSRITFNGDQLWHQDSSGIENSVETGDLFGYDVAVGDLDGNGRADLAIGVPGEDVGTIKEAGAVNVIYGSSTTLLRGDNDQSLRQGFDGLRDQVEVGDHFGGPLPIGARTRGFFRPARESKPDAAKTVYLDFTGHTESRPFGLESLVTPVFDMDGESDGHFSLTELAVIDDVWAHVAEDYAPFNVNVTTAKAPGDDGVRVAIGGDWDDWYHEGASGVNLSWTWFVGNTVWGFSDTILDLSNLGDDVAARIGTTASHEAGHYFGLEHKGDFERHEFFGFSWWELGDPDDEYSVGTGNMVPIMGNNLSTGRTIWTEAHIDTGADTAIRGSDDMTVLANALGRRADDHPSNPRAANVQHLGTFGSFGLRRVVAGIIEQNSDQDAFVFDVTTTAEIGLRGLVNEVGADLDLRLELGRIQGNTIQSLEVDNPDDSLDASITRELTPGRYFVRVSSTADFQGDVGQFTVRIDWNDPNSVANVPIMVPMTFVTDLLIADLSNGGTKSTNTLVKPPPGKHLTTLPTLGTSSLQQTPGSKLTTGRKKPSPGAASDMLLSADIGLDIAGVDAFMAELGQSGR